MNSSNRLLFAAARGARVQFCLYKGEWHTAREIEVSKDEQWPQRIHPDDTHLQYGPVSTALRETAETGESPFTLVGLMAETAFSYEIPYPLIFTSEWEQRTLFLLILAEALADTGL